MNNKRKGYIYLLSNKSFPTWYKIGYSANINERLKVLNNSTATPFPFKLVGYYEAKKDGDKKIHKLIDRLNKNKRSVDEETGRTREFFEFESLEDAKEVFDLIAEIQFKTPIYNDKIINSNTTNKKQKNSETNRTKKSRWTFDMYGINIGEELVYIDDDKIRPIVISKNKIEWNNKIYSLSSLAKELRNSNSLQGPLFFTYKGKLLIDIRKEKEDK